MTSSSSSSTSASQRWKYHVFLSYREEDSSQTFVGNLYSALEHQGIRTYKDDKTLPRGEWVGPSLIKAIEESQILIIVFCKNYAHSSSSLDELAHIMKCKDSRGQIVIPLFYDVDPSDVANQKRKYEEAFSKHDEIETTNKVESWRKALVDASNVSGWVPKIIINGHESKFIKEIVDTISKRLQLVTSSANENLIGLEARMEDLKSKLEIGSGGVRTIGIWGAGGGGKTTLASCMYYEIRSKFEGFYFLENIRQESSKNGLEKLQEKILSGALKEKKVQVGGVEEGRRMLMGRLCHKKVLIVLDDVDRLDQLEALAGSHDWFGEGSRMIITTRDKDLLTAYRVDVIHNISLFNDDEAIELFRRHAPRDNRPMEDYEVLSKEVVSYAGGLPLALKVLGCFLCDKDMNEWRSALNRLKEIPDDKILEKLKISFDGLTTQEKELFLDIACFFTREDKEKAMKMLDACDFHPVSGVKVLIQKALITISDGMFDMHDLVQELGHYVVRGEHPHNPEKHSRVWKKEDVAKICAMDATKDLDIIKAIKFKCNGADPSEHLPLIVANMKNLRWIDYEGDLASPLPSNFSPRELSCLKLDGSSQKQLWEGYKDLPNLRIMELYGLSNLMMTPNFNGLPNLKKFKLTGSWHLEEVHESIGRLEGLVFLSIEFCVSLKVFPPITQLKKLETLTLSRCPKLFKISEIQQEKINCIGLQLAHRDLRKLDLSYCDLGDEAIGSAVWFLPYLKELNLAGNKFSRLNFSRLRLPRLKCLNISSCERLVELSELPLSIAVVIADGCTSLDTYGDVSKCKWLWKVSHRRGKKLGGDILLYSMLQGNAIEDHFISVTLEHQNPEGFVGRLLRGKTSSLHLPNDWYNDFCGFLICIVTDMKSPQIDIIIKQEVDKDSLFELWQEYNYEAVELEYDGTITSVGYVSFNSLRPTALLTSSYGFISFSVEDRFSGSNAAESYVGAKLIPRESKGDQVQTTKDCSEFWDEEGKHGNTFTVEHDSKSSIKIQWFP